MATKSVRRKTAAKEKSAAGHSRTRRTASHKTTSKKAAKKATGKRWSSHVNETSNAMDIQPGIFRSTDPKKVAGSLKRSAEKSDRKKAAPFQSAMSMLNFYINRGGKNLPAGEKKVLERAKKELRKLYHRPEK